MKKITRSRLLGLLFALFATSVATAQTTPTITAWSQQTGQQGVASNGFNWWGLGLTSWSNGYADGQGSVGWFNFDINPWISIADVNEQMPAGTGSGTVPQVFTLSGVPTNNSLSVSDGFFYWSQSKGSNSTAFIVNYSPLTNTVSVLYNPGVAANRKITVSYAKAVAGTPLLLIAITDNVNRVFSKKLGSPVKYDSTFTVGDGTYTWTADPLDPNGGHATMTDAEDNQVGVDRSIYDVQYDPLALTITVTYGSVFGSVDHNGGAGVAFVGRPIKAQFQTKAAFGVTMGTLGLGDPGQNQGLGESYNLRMNSLTFDNNGAMSNIIKVNGFSGDEVASGIHLTGPLAVAVRTGGDVTNSLRLSGNIDGIGGLVKADSGNLTITGNNTFSGPMIIRDTAGTTFLRSGVTLLNCVTTVGRTKINSGDAADLHLGDNVIVCSSTSGLEPGMSLAGTNIQPGTVITYVHTDGVSFTITPTALANTTAVSNLTLVAKTTSGILVRNAATVANSRLVTIPENPPATIAVGDTKTYSTSNTNGLAVGMALSGTGMPVDAFVASITGLKSFTITSAATVTSGAAGVTLVAEAGNFKLAKTTLTNVSVTEASPLVLCDDTSGLFVGMSLTGLDAASIAALPVNAVITAIVDARHFTMSPVAPDNSGNQQTIEHLTLLAAVTGNSLVTTSVTLPTITLAPVALPTKVMEKCTLRTDQFSIACPSTLGLVVGMSVTSENLANNTRITKIVDATHFEVNIKPEGSGGAIITVGTATTSGSGVITTYSTAGLVQGMSISGDNIQPNSVITAINADGIHFTLNKNATATGSGLNVFKDYATTAGSPDVLAVATTGLVAGQTITATGPGAGPYIAPDTKIDSIIAATATTPLKVRLNANAVASSSGLTLKVGTIIKNGQSTVTVASTAGLVTGMIVRGPGIPSESVITAIPDAFSFVMSRNATADGSLVTVTASVSPGLSLTGLSTTAGSSVISSTSGGVITGLVTPVSSNFPNGLVTLEIGTILTGIANIPDNSVVTSIAADHKSFTISAPATGSGTNQLFVGMSSAGLTITGASTVVGTRVVTCDSTTGLVVGSLVTGFAMPDNAIVVAIADSSHFTLSANATATASPLTLKATAGGYALKNFGQSVTGASTVVNSNVVTASAASVALLRVGMVVTADNNIQLNGENLTVPGPNTPLTRSVIVSIPSATTFTLSTNATATGAVTNMLASDPRVVAVAVTDAATVPGSTTITLSGSTNTAGLRVGQLITGSSPFIAPNSIITAKTINTITVSMPAGGAAPQGGLTLLATTPPGLPLLGASTQLNSTTVTLTSTTALAPGMLLTGKNLPTNAVITDVVNATSVTISSKATGTGSNLTLLAASIATLPIYNAQTTNGISLVEVDSLSGLSVGLPVSGDGIPGGATITGFNGPTGAPNNRAASFTISAPAQATASGLTLMAKVPLMNADVVITNAMTQNKNRAIYCDSTVGMVAGMAVVGPNIPAGATVSAISGTRLFVISLPASADGWGLTLGVGTNAISASSLVLGTANRDGNSSAVLQLSAPNQINDDAVILFDGASSRNPYLRMLGFSEALGGIIDYTSNGVIENTEGETGAAGVFANSVMTLNTAMNYDYNGYIRNKSSGDSTGTIGITKLGVGVLTLTGGNISYTGDTTIRGGGLKLVNTTNFGSNINVSRNNTVELSTTGDWQFNQQIFGAGNLIKTGLNVVTLANDISFTGQTIVNQGTLRVASGVINQTVGATNTGATTYTITLTRAPAPGTLYVEDKNPAGDYFHSYHEPVTGLVSTVNPGNLNGTTSTANGGWTVIYNRVTRLLTVTYPAAQTGPARNIVVSYRPSDAQRIGNSNGSDKVFSTTLPSVPADGTLYVTDSVNNPIAVFDSTTGNPTSGKFLPVGQAGGSSTTMAGSPSITYNSTTRLLTVTYASAPAYNLALTAVWSAKEGINATSAIVLNSGTFLIENQNTKVVGNGNNPLLNRPELNDGDRVSNTAPILSNGGNLIFRHNAGAENYSETLGALNLLSGSLTITSNVADAGSTSSLTFASLNRVAGSGATVTFNGGNALGLSAISAQKFTTAPPLLNGTMIGGYAVIQDGANLDFATYTPGLGIRGIVQTIPQRAATTVANWTATRDVALRGGNITLTKDTTVNSLVMSENASRSLIVNVGKVLTVNSGGIIFAQNSGGNVLQITTGKLTAGPQSGYELDLWTSALAQTNTISAAIVNNPGVDTNTANGNDGLIVVKGGLGEVKLTGPNTYTGGTRINGGNLEINSLPNLGILPSASGSQEGTVYKSDFLVLNGGTLQVTAKTAGAISTVDFSSVYGVTLGVGGGAFAIDPSVTVNIASPIIGPGGLAMGTTLVGNTGVNQGDVAGNLFLSGNNSFQGTLAAVFGTVTLLDGTNVFSKGMTTSSGGTIDVHKGSALPFNPTLTMTGGSFILGSDARIGTLTGADGSVIGLEDDTGTTGVTQVVNPLVPILLTIDQTANSTFTGSITDNRHADNSPSTLLGIEKKGPGVLTLNQSTSALSNYRGITKISEGIIAAAVLSTRQTSSSIGTGGGGRERDVGSSDLLYIENGAGLSYTGTGSAFTNRPFTIGVGALGAGLYANGVGNGSILQYEQEILFIDDVNNGTTRYIGQDILGFSRPNEAATLTLGGRNLGDNIFAMDLHDNGTGPSAKPLSLQKSGDGNWVGGLALGTNLVLHGCGVGNAEVGGVEAANVVTCTSTVGLVSGMRIVGSPAIAPGTRVGQIINSTTFQILIPALAQVSASPGIDLYAIADSVNDFTGNTVIYLGNLALAQNGVLGAATGATLTLTGCVTTQGGTADENTLVTCSSTAKLVPGMALKGPTMGFGAKVADIVNATSFHMNLPAVRELLLTYCVTHQGQNIVRCDSTETLSLGMEISGLGIPSGAHVTKIVDNTHFQMDLSATDTFDTIVLNSCTTTTGLRSIGTESTFGLAEGMTVGGPGLAAGSRITSIDGPSAFTVDLPALDTFNASVFLNATVSLSAHMPAGNLTLTATGGGIVQLISGNLDLRDVQYTSAKTLALDGGRLRALVGDNLWAGNVITDIGSTVEIGTGVNLDLAGAISGRAGITKIGFGTLILEGANTFAGGFNASEGTLRLDYSRSPVGKLADAGTLTLGGGRKGATLDLVGNAASNEKIGALTLSLGLNRITRSDPNSTTKIATNVININQGGTIDFGYKPNQIGHEAIATSDRPNDGALANASTGILGAWATVNLSDWASNATNGITAPADGDIVPYAANNYTQNAWGGLTSNANVTQDMAPVSGSATYTLRFGANVSTNTTLTGDNLLRGGGILQAPSAGAVSNIIKGGRLILGNNFQGGNLVIQQHDKDGSLQINSAIANSPDIRVASAISWGFNGSPQGNANNRFYMPAGLFIGDFYTGMTVLGQNIRPGSLINGFQNAAVTGTNFNISQNIASKLTLGIGEQKIPVLANLKPDTNSRRIHLIFDTGSNPKPYPLPTRFTKVIGLGVPPGTYIDVVESETDYLLSDDVPTQVNTGLFLSPRPPFTANLTATTVTITDATNPSPPLVANQSITGPGIPDGTRIKDLTGLKTFTTTKTLTPGTGIAVTMGSPPPPATTFPFFIGQNGVTNQIHITTNTPGNSIANLPNPPLVAGQLVTGPGIPEGTIISSVIGTTPAGTDFLLNNNVIVPFQYAKADLHPGAVAKLAHITDLALPNPPLDTGYYVTGPGVPDATVIVSISPDGRDLLLSNPLPVSPGVRLSFSPPQIQTATLRADGVANKIRITDAALPNPPLAVGQVVTGPNIPLGTTIIEVLDPVLTQPTDYIPAGTDFLLSSPLPAVIGEVIRVTPLPLPTVTFNADLVVDGNLRQFHITDDLPPSTELKVGQQVTHPNIPDGTVITEILPPTDMPWSTDFRVSNDMTPAVAAPGAPIIVATAINLNFQMWGELSVSNAFNQVTINNSPAYQMHMSVGNTTGMAVDQTISGAGIPKNATIAGFVGAAGNTDFYIRFPNSHVLSINHSVGTTFIGDVAIANNGLQIHLTRGVSIAATTPVGATVEGDDIQPGTLISSLVNNGTDFTVNRSIFAPVEDIIIQSRNGLLKTGDGVAQLGGSNTFTGPVTITGGTLSVPQVTNGGQAGTLGSSTIAASNITIGGGTLQYTGDSASVNRGFTINEVGGIDVSKSGVTLNFTGNLSGGVGAALGTLQKFGQGTLQLSRTVTFGGATNFGGFDVVGGTLQLKYNNPNDGAPNDRFASTLASLTLSGGKFELVGTPDNIPLTGSNTSEDRSQALRGQFTVNTGASQVWVTGARNTAITLTLQDAATPFDPIRQNGGTVLFVENPNGGTSANITLALNQNFTGKPLTWATYWDTSLVAQPGVNNFAAIEPSDYGIVSADSTRLYTTTSRVVDWDGASETVTESGTAFSGTLETGSTVNAIRFFAKADGYVGISNTGGVGGAQAILQLKGGAILAATNSGNFAKVIEGGQITSGLTADGSSSNDFIIHNYNPAHAFDLKSEIVDNTIFNPARKVNLVITGTGTTTLYGNNLSTSPNFNKNTYSGTTYLNGGVLRLANAGALPGGVNASGGTSNLVMNGGVLGLSVDFTRGLGTGIDQVQWTGNGGFAAYGNDVNINLGGATTPLGVVWGANSFVPDSAELRFSSQDATNTVHFLNPVNLGGIGRTVNVADSIAAIDAEMTGKLTGNGGSLVKTGQGTLRLATLNQAPNEQTGGGILAQGKLSTNANGLGSGPLGIGTTDSTNATDVLTLELRGGTFLSSVTVGDKNSTGLTTISAAASPIINGSMTLGRRIFFGPEGGRKITINGGVKDSLDGNALLTGNGAFTVVDGGVVLINGAGNLGAGDAAGQAVDGSIILRSGSLYVGNSQALGTSVVEMGDRASVRRFIVDRTSGGRSILLQGGLYDPRSSGRSGTSNGSGGFIFNRQSSLVIDGKTYTESDSLLDGDPSNDALHHHRTLIMVNGEVENPDRNGLFELVYAVGDSITLANSSTTLLKTTVIGATTTFQGTRVDLTGSNPTNDPTIHTTTENLKVGMIVTGSTVTPGLNELPFTIASIDGPRQFTLSRGASGTTNSGSSITLNFSIGSQTINTLDTSSLEIGAPIFGPTIPVGAVVTAIIDPETFTIDKPVTAATTLPVPLNARLGDAIGLNRIAEFDDPTEMVYGVQVSVTNGSDANKTFFLATDVAVSFDNNFFPPIPIYTPTLWKLDALNPNISLLASAPPVAGTPIVVTNAIDINGLSAGGTISLGGSSSLLNGSATFSGPVVLQNGSITLTGGSTFGATGTAAQAFEVTVDSTAQVAVGMLITGSQIQSGSTVVSIKSGSVLVLNKATTNSSPSGSQTYIASYTPVTRNIRLLSDSLDGRGVVFSGVFSEADLTGDKMGLQKLGTGTVTLEGANTYRGGTIVSNGTLKVDNASGSGTGTGTVTVQNFGSTLGGKGIISGNTTITNGAVLSPGSGADGLGTLSFLGDVYMGPGSLASFQIGGADADFLSIAGTFTVDPTAIIRVLLTNNFVPGESISYDLITWGLPSSLNLVDLLDLPSLVDESFFWDTSLFNTQGVLALSQRQATDPPVARFAVRSARVAETVGSDVVVRVAIQLDTPAPVTGVDIPLLLTGSTATETAAGVQGDFDLLPPAGASVNAPHIVHFDAGQTSSDIIIQVHNDPRSEPSETVNLSFVAQNTTNNKVLKGSPGIFTLTIDDDDSTNAAGSKWVLRNPAPTNERMQGLAVGHTTTTPVAIQTTVAVGSAGRILHSLDNGASWTSVMLGLSTDLHSVAVRPAAGTTAAQFVAVGDEGLVVTSPDGINWTYHNASGEKRLLSVTYSASADKFVAVGQGGVLFSSVKGESWIYHDSGVNKDLNSVIFANGLFVAVGLNGAVTTSADGLTWASGATGSAANLRAVAFKTGTPNLFMAVGDAGAYFTSPDAITWTLGSVNAALPNLRSLHVEAASNRFIAAGLGGVVYVFTGNGPGWTAASTTGTTEDLLFGISIPQSGGNISLITGGAGTFVKTSTVNSWVRTGAPDISSNPTSYPTGEFSTVAFTGSRFLAMGQKGLFGTTAADDFTFSILPGANLSTSRMNAIAIRPNGNAVAVGSNAAGDAGLAAISLANGTDWSPTGATGGPALNGVIFANNAYYAVGDAGTILVGTPNDTTHNVTWAPAIPAGASISTESLQSIAYSGTLFIVVGTNGAVLSSPDGINWEDISPGGLPGLTSVAWTGSQFIVVGAGGTVLTSVDGGIFTKRTVSVFNDLTDVVSTPAGAYAVGAGGTILGSSADGVTWTVLNSGTGQDLKDIAWNPGNGRLTAVGASGTILTSDPVVAVRPSAFFVVSEMTVDERSGVVNVPVFLTQIPSTDLYLKYTVNSTGLASPATLTADYTAAAAPLKFLLSSVTPAEIADGTLTRNIAITLKSDAVKELNPEHLRITLNEFVTSANKPLTTAQPGDVLDPKEFILTITDTVAPTVDFSPDVQHAMVAVGDTVSLTTTVSGSFPTITWLKGTAAVAGITTDTYNIAAATIANGGTYTVKAVNPAGTDTTNAKAKGLVAPLGTVELSVVDTSSPLVLVKPAGSTVLTALAGGNGLTYAWYLTGSPNPLGNGTAYTVAGAKLTIKGVNVGANEGDYYCIVSQTGTGHNTGLSMSTGLFHVKAAGMPDIQPPATPSGAAPRGKVGAAYSFELPRPSKADSLSPNTPLSYTISGQPAGLVINAKTGVITGVPTTATPSDKQVTVKATNPFGTFSITFALGIDPLEPAVIGSFVALADRSESAAVDGATKLAYGTLGLGARLDVTTTAAGIFSGKLTVGPTAYPFTNGKLVTTASDNPSPHNPEGTVTIARGVGKSPLVVFFSLDPLNNLLTGTVSDVKGSANLKGWRNQWTTASKVPANVTVIHNFIADKQGGPATDGSEPEGSSFGSITPAVAGTGAVTVAGKAADGTVLATVGVLGPNGEVLVYQSMYTVPGTFMGILNIDLFVDTAMQKITTDKLSWSHPKQTTGRTFVLGWPAAPLELGVDGGKYYPAAATAGPAVFMNLMDTTANTANPSNADLEFTGGFVTSTTSHTPSLMDVNGNGVQIKPFTVKAPATVVVPTGANNPTGTTLVVNNATGAFSGVFSFTDPDAPGGKPYVRKVNYYGVIVPKTATGDVYDASGYGYFLLQKRPSNTPPVTTTTTSPILSGLVVLESNQ